MSFTNVIIDYDGNVFSNNKFIDKTYWFIDSGASSHIYFYKDLFIVLKPITNKFVVVFPDGIECQPTLCGSVQINPSIVIEDVFFVPTFKFNLLSVSSLLQNSKMTIMFTNTHCYI